MNKPTKRLRSIILSSNLLLGAALMVSGPIAASAQTPVEVGPSVVADSPDFTPMSDKNADMKEVIINVFGMT